MLKHNVAQYYLSLDEKQLQNPVKTEQEADVSIAATFAQNYGIAFQVLDELRRRVGKEGSFHPKSVLSCGSGPATGMLALNELMGENFNPEVKDVLIHGDFHMMRRAKLLLSRQLCEYLPRGENASLGEGVGDEKNEEIKQEVKQEVKGKVREEFKGKVKEEFKGKDKETMNVEKDEENSDQQDYVGKVKTKDIHIKSILMDKFRPISRKYDLIIAERELLRDKGELSA
ncbi:putative mitochondrial ribosomal protein rsm22p [Brettanomyces bruxellensis AWRI1499]|nr:putative mitochondrial ribosomal protein rsm22p [Brettanomyces bruxellensis AWRI1499]